MICPKCNKEYNLEKKTYDDLWFQYLDEAHNVEIYCTERSCMLEEVLVTEEPRPDRMMMTFGKYIGKKLSDIDDDSYLEWLSRSDSSDLLLVACVNKLI